MEEIRKQTNEESHSLSQSKSHTDKETDIYSLVLLVML